MVIFHKQPWNIMSTGFQVWKNSIWIPSQPLPILGGSLRKLFLRFPLFKLGMKLIILNLWRVTWGNVYCVWSALNTSWLKVGVQWTTGYWCSLLLSCACVIVAGVQHRVANRTECITNYRQTRVAYWESQKIIWQFCLSSPGNHSPEWNKIQKSRAWGTAQPLIPDSAPLK